MNITCRKARSKTKVQSGARTTGLDPGSADGIDQLIRQLNEALGVTVVVVTHDLNTLFSVCDRVAVLAGGKITVGTTAQLMRSKQAGVREFLSGPRVEAAITTAAVAAKKTR